MQRKNPYDALRAIVAKALDTPMGLIRKPGSQVDCILKLANEALKTESATPPYATQDDVLDAIRGRCKQVPWGAPSSHLAMAIQDLAELGLVLPAIKLTPAQRVADKLVDHAFDYLRLAASGDAGPILNGHEIGDLRALLEPLRPAPPPTLEEALQAVRDLTHELRCADKGLVGTERAQVIARAQALTARAVTK